MLSTRNMGLRKRLKSSTLPMLRSARTVRDSHVLKFHHDVVYKSGVNIAVTFRYVI